MFTARRKKFRANARRRSLSKSPDAHGKAVQFGFEDDPSAPVTPTLFTWPDGPEWLLIRHVDVRLQQYLWTTFGELAPEMAAMKEYSMHKLLSRLDKGIEGAVKVAWEIEANVDEMPDGFKLPVAREVSCCAVILRGLM